ncbi:MAG: hypothetical protein HC866_13910 [Leptolyngbyaceae cyanobacterium RU_5_1]|nr:hypothetical protein [Leptolyngbyaceae cyanobacterium RU_5_1]
MEKKLCSSNSESMEVKVEQDLWEALLYAEGIQCDWQSGEPLTEDAIKVEDHPEAKISYPWNPFAPEAESFLTKVDTPSIFDGWQEKEVMGRANAFFAKVDRLWSSASLQSTLAQRFAARIPQNFLAAIAQQAQQAVSEAQKAVSASVSMADHLADQLVQCVREIAPSLADDDLRVLARPLAYQMRNGGLQNAIESVLAQVPQADWQQLSEVQRARLSLAIARCAIDELQSQKDV